MLGGLSIDVLPVRNSDDENQQFVIGHRVDNSKPADPDAVPVAAPCKLVASRRTGFVGQGTNPRDDALSVSLLVNGLDLLGRGRLDENLITCHAA